MSDLEGMDAFSLVLDRLLAATNETHTLREKAGDAQGDLRKAMDENVRLSRRVASLESDASDHREKVLPKLAALYAAAEIAAKRLRVLGADDDIQLEQRMNTALREARDHCDQLPF